MEVKAEEDQPLTEAHIFVITLDSEPEDMIRSNGRFHENTSSSKQHVVEANIICWIDFHIDIYIRPMQAMNANPTKQKQMNPTNKMEPNLKST